jgi:putative transposase
LQGQIYLGSEVFVKKMQAHVDKRPALDEIPRAQCRALSQFIENYARRYPRNEAMARAHLSGQHTMASIAEHFGVHYSTVSRMVKQYETWISWAC